jgi:hypothetical protein
MKSVQHANFALAALAGGSWFVGIGASQAKGEHSAHAHDGIYALHIVTHRVLAIRPITQKLV